MTAEVQAILFDTRSIQRYIFSGNKLRTNVGASYIVDTVFETLLVEDVLKRLPQLKKTNFNTWRDEVMPSFGRALSEEGYDCCIAYIGGGKALLLFRADMGEAFLKGIVTAFSKQVLAAYPGLKTGAAIGKLDLSTEETYRKTNAVLHSRLKQYQNTVFPVVSIPNTGLTQTCPISGEVADYRDVEHLLDKNNVRYFSREVAVKADMAEMAAKALRKNFAVQIQGYDFPMELDQLGQKETENYIAIVHIDGNNMGRRFMACKTLEEQAVLSKRVREKTAATFGKLLQGIVKTYDAYKNELNAYTAENQLLPIRPIILGGDDVTFVCAARFALSFTRQFILLMRQDTAELEGIECCGGIAISPTSYPFFRAYSLAEQVCGEAKSKSREKNDSWLDFVIIHGEQAPTLSQIREREYKGVQGDLHFGPYFAGGDMEHSMAVEKLMQCVDGFRNPGSTGLAQNKIKELRDVLHYGRHTCQQFMEQLAHTKKNLPYIPGWEAYQDTLWAQRKTPYMDAIELMDFSIGEV